jgi:dihydroorotate dehydrogenase
VQLYTGLIYRGPRVIGEILDGLSRAVAARNVDGLADLVGRSAREWALGGA